MTMTYESDINIATTRDFSFSPSFVNHCRDSTLPVAVVGNGGSLEMLNSKTIDIINESRLLRCNWAFNDPSDIKKQYTMYFSQAYGSSREKELVDQLDEQIENKKLDIFRYHIHILYNDDPMCSLATPGKVPVWPTTGIQMLLYAAFKMQLPALHVAGIDMYTHKRPSRVMSKADTQEYLKKYGKKFSSSPDNSAGLTMFKENLCLVPPTQWRSFVKNTGVTEHYVEVDVLILMLCFAHLIVKKIPVYIYECNVLQQVYDITNNNITTIRDYFTQTTQALHHSGKQKSSYTMWRLVNQTVDEVLPA